MIQGLTVRWYLPSGGSWGSETVELTVGWVVVVVAAAVVDDSVWTAVVEAVVVVGVVVVVGASVGTVGGSV